MRNLEKAILFGYTYLGLFLISLFLAFVSDDLTNFLIDILLLGFLGVDSDDSAALLIFVLTPVLWLANMYLLYTNKYVYNIKSKKIFVWLSFLPVLFFLVSAFIILTIVGIIG